jgi:hypothetical protein
MVRPERFELPTYCSGGNRSIQLSYGRAPNIYSLHGWKEGLNVALGVALRGAAEDRRRVSCRRLTKLRPRKPERG